MEEIYKVWKMAMNRRLSDDIKEIDRLALSAILKNTPNKAAELICDVLESAGANAENNMGLNKQDLFVSEIYSGQGPTYKRQNIRGRGRVDQILKRTSNITVKLDTRK